MAAITAGLVKDLREKTGAGMMDCKQALTETDGDVEGAIDWLRKKGLAAAAKKSGRVAAEGLVAVASAPGKAAMVEVNAETDFVARNVTFQDFVATVANIALQVGDDLDAIKAAPFPGSGRTVADELIQMVATIGENMTLRRAKLLTVGQGVVATYMHGALKPGVGKIGVLAAIEGPGELGTLELLGRQVGMHVAAARPDALEIDSVDPAALERERAVLSEQARASGKPEPIIEKMVEGRVESTTRKWCCWSRYGCMMAKAGCGRSSRRLALPSPALPGSSSAKASKSHRGPTSPPRSPPPRESEGPATSLVHRGRYH